MPGDFSGVASKHSVIFGKFKYTGTRRLLTVQKGSRQIFLKNNNNNNKLLIIKDWSQGKGIKFPRVFSPKISLKRFYTDTSVAIKKHVIINKKSEISKVSFIIVIY